MGFRLPGTDLYCLDYDRLKPELFERILFPSISWSEICKSYEFYDGPANGLFIVNIRPRQNGSRIQNSGGERDKQKLKQMVFSGDVVMLNKGYSPAGLFFIDAQGELQCRNTGAFSRGGADRVIRSYQRSVSRSDYSRNGNKPRPTPDRYLRPEGWQEDNPLNSQFGGAWLAAAGMYHQQQEAFAQIARQAGSKAEREYNTLANGKTAGIAMAAGALLGARKANTTVKIRSAPSIEKRTVELSSGGKGGWSKGLNKPEPDAIYKVDGSKIYETDHLSRPVRVESILTLKTKERNTYQQSVSGKTGELADEGGHLIASIFDGPGEKLNLVPMNANLNRSAWKRMENQWADALKDGKMVKVKILPSYTGDSARPDKFKVTYSIDGNKPVERVFKNAPGGS